LKNKVSLAELPKTWNNANSKHWFLYNFFVVLMLTACLLFCGCSPKPARYEQTFFDVFDTVTMVIVYDTDENAAQQTIDEAYEMLARYHKLFDIYNAYEGLNNLYTVNQNAGDAPVPVDEDILDLIAFGMEMYDTTDGALNIAMGSVTALWTEYREAGMDDPDRAALPPQDALEEAGRHTDISGVVIDRAAGTLYLADSDLRLDVGAIAKGYAVQRVVERLKSEGVRSLLISAGGNVCAVGTKADGSNWKVGVQDPYSGGYLLAVRVDDRSLVTSGTYERYYTVDGKDYHHIIDPKTLYPSVYYDSVSVLCADSALADALTTGLFCMQPEEGEALVASLGGVEALWVLPDGTQTASAGFEAYVVSDGE
jgi:thiamine biosynthesis lipoprotein